MKIAVKAFYFLAFIVLLELSVRYFWGGPVDISKQKWEKFKVQTDSVAGIACISGKNYYPIGSDSFEVNCMDGRGRSTSENPYPLNSANVIFYGCSFTFGHGLADSMTFPWKIQKNNPHLNILNFGYEGFGVSQFYAQILSLLKKNNLPDLVIVNYAHFHDYRNLALRIPRRNTYYYQEDKSMLLKIKFPVLVLENSGLELKYTKYFYDYPFPFVEYSAFLNFFDFTIASLSDRLKKPEKITLEAFKILNQKCKEKNVVLIVNGIVSDSKTQNTLKKLSESGIETTHISIDLANKELLLEDGFHPNKQANIILTEEFDRLIKQKLKE